MRRLNKATHRNEQSLEAYSCSCGCFRPCVCSCYNANVGATPGSAPSSADVYSNAQDNARWAAWVGPTQVCGR